MRRFFFVLILLILLFAMPCAAGDFALRGVWVSTVYNLDYPSRTGLSADALQAEADAILENAADWGLNAVFLQVRPAGDALYPSQIFPWSVWLSGTQGQAPEGRFDPLGYFIERAHGLDIEVHAWINPYRITRTARDSREAALAAISPDHPAHGMSEAVVLAEDGCLYFDPGRPESRALIAAGVQEILENYPVDGIHLDDYFYPSAGLDDSGTFAAFGAAFDGLGDFRRASVTQLIQMLQNTVKAHNENVDFGVSPFGIWANGSQHPEGSDTAGDSSHFSHYADTRSWVQEGLVDYIMPQLYWQIGSREADFETLLDWWSGVTECKGVNLYIGLAAYRGAAAETDSVWFEGGELLRQLEAMGQSAAQGVCLFRYRSLLENLTMAEGIAEVLRSPLPRPVPLPLLPTEMAFLTPEGTVLARAGGGFDVTFSGPAGVDVHVQLNGAPQALAYVGDGIYNGSIPVGAAVQAATALAQWELGGLVCVRILPLAVQVVETGAPVSITRIASRDANGGHEVSFTVDSPVVAALTRHGAAVELRMEPVAMAVLFEDDFLEAVSVRVEDGVCVYTLLLPVGQADCDAKLQWREEKVTVIFSD